MAKHAKHARDSKESAPLAQNTEEFAAHENASDAVAPDAAQDASAADGSSAQDAIPVAYEVAGNNAPEAVKGIPAHQRKSRRVRIALIVVVAVLAVLMVALGYFAWMLMSEAHDVAYQTAAQSEKADGKDSVASETNPSEARKSAPSLVALLGLTQDEALSKLGHGATVSTSKEITEETGEGDEKTTEVVGWNVTIVLTDESTDARGNAPTVYLTLDKDGKTTSAAYAASLSALGYGDISFSDAVKTEHVVESLVSDAGIPVGEGSVEMPAAEDYRTYADDGATIAQEQYTFSGEGAGSDGATYAWSCRLNYDYSAANVSGNLADTLRQVYLSVSA